MITWPALEHAAQQAGWRRQGKAWRGPCPLCGGRQDRAWVGPGTTADFVAGCNGGCDGLEIARALVPDSDPSPGWLWRQAARARKGGVARAAKLALRDSQWSVMHHNGFSYRDIARVEGMSHATVIRAVRRSHVQGGA